MDPNKVDLDTDPEICHTWDPDPSFLTRLRLRYVQGGNFDHVGWFFNFNIAILKIDIKENMPVFG